MLNTAIFDPWQRSLFSRRQTAGKEPLLAENFMLGGLQKRGPRVTANPGDEMGRKEWLEQLKNMSFHW